jgi:hypothetical protein
LDSWAKTPNSRRCGSSRFALTPIALLRGEANTGPFGVGLAWGIAIAVVALVQLTIALMIERDYDPTMPRAFLLEPLYVLWFWAISSLVALRTQTVGLLRGAAQAARRLGHPAGEPRRRLMPSGGRNH